MRIALIVPEFPPFHIGGGGVAFEALARRYALSEDVAVFTAHDPLRSWFIGRVSQERSEEGVIVNRYALAPIGKKAPYLRSVVPPSPVALRDLFRQIVAWSPDVAHIHGVGYAMIDATAFMLRRASIPYVLTCHGVPKTPLQKSAVLRLLYRAYEVAIARRTIEGSEIATAVSESVRADLAHVSPKTTCVVPNGVSLLPRPSAAAVDDFRRSLDIGDDEILVAGAGRLSGSKGFDLLLAAVDRLESKSVVCVIAGEDGGERAALEERGRSLGSGRRLVLPGRLDRATLAKLFLCSNVVVVPSRDEPFGFVAFEALALDRRVVAADTGGMSEFLNGTHARLVDPEDTEALAKVIQAAINESPTTASEVEAARHQIEKLSWQRATQMYGTLLRQAADRSLRCPTSLS
jgi:glycosyltransferase involved in cell wall biosynthesis